VRWEVAANGFPDLADTRVTAVSPINSTELKEIPMHDFLVALVFMAMLMTPCVMALTTRLDDAGSD